MEIWKDIKGYEGIYSISNKGLIINKKGNFINGCLGKSGNIIVRLSKNKVKKTYTIHRLVAEHFIPNPNGFKYVIHRGEKSNNSSSNLYWSRNVNLGSKWKKSPLYDGLIECSIDGEIRNSNGEILDQIETIGGYKKVRIDGKLTSVSTLIATTFIDGFHEHPTVRHKDLNKSNNSVENLLWINPKNEIQVTKCITEKWKTIKGIKISNWGNTEYNQTINVNGFQTISIKNKKIVVHRLVALEFIDSCKTTSRIIHIDGNKLNNRVDNLQEIKVVKEVFPFN